MLGDTVLPHVFRRGGIAGFPFKNCFAAALWESLAGVGGLMP